MVFRNIIQENFPEIKILNQHIEEAPLACAWKTNLRMINFEMFPSKMT